jgi:RimJ/RimL family protein N-acetyltransferase
MIRFREMCADDLEFFIAIRNECADFLDDNTRFTINQCREWFRKSKPKFYILTHNNNDVGYFRTSSWNEDESSVFIGCDIHRTYRGMGIAKLAYPKFMNFMLESFGFKTFILYVLEFNVRAISLYEKVGFKRTNKKTDPVFRGKEKIKRIEMKMKISK